MSLGLRTALDPAPDRAAAKRWFEPLLGVAHDLDGAFAVGCFELRQLPDALPAASRPPALWGVADIKAARAHLIALRAAPLESITAVGEGIGVAAVMAPFGCRLSRIENPQLRAGAVP